MKDNQGQHDGDKPRKSSARPKIPMALQRELLIECGHRCAVCGESFPLERAHIIPWCKAREHALENLICLCANCHARADKEPEHWGAETLREYKRRPWVLRRFSEVSAAEPTSRVRFHLAIDFEAFDPRQRLLLAHGLASFLGLDPNAVHITSVERGSVKVEVELPSEAAERLREVLSDRSPLLEAYLQPFGGILYEMLPKPQTSIHSDTSSRGLNCREVGAILFLFFDNEMEEDLLPDFRDHVSTCLDCAKRIDYTRKLLLIVRERCTRYTAPQRLVDRIQSSLSSLHSRLDYQQSI